MKILMISDILPQKEHAGRDEIKHIRLVPEKIGALANYNAVVVDLTTKRFSPSAKMIQRAKVFDRLRERLKQDDINKNSLVIMIICGAERQDFEIDVPSYEFPDSDPYNERKRFWNYDILSDIIPAHIDRLKYDKGEAVHSVAPRPFAEYFAMNGNLPTYLYYDYDPDSRECADITPLAKMREDGNAIVALERRIGKGVVVLLTGYDNKNKAVVLQRILKICRTYCRKQEVKRPDNLLFCKEIPATARMAYGDAWECFDRDLYGACLFMCRVALEASVKNETSNLKKKVNLSNRIDELTKTGLLSEKFMQLAKLIKDFGNIGAHAVDKLKEITEADAESAINMLEIYFEYFYVLPRQMVERRQREQVLNEKENIT